MKQSAYRSDIDGMRAIAVLSVIIFHLDKAWLPGGFVGVDIFFVISGYLISRQLFQEMSAGSFSFVHFYQRRIKRIAPASLLVIAVTVFLSQLILLPTDAELVAESGLWAILSLANVYFWLSNDTGYFAAASEEIPLLHLWSLGVEEQFYLLWPLVLYLSFRCFSRQVFLWMLVLVIAGSFSFGYVIFKHDAAFAYYMLPSRAGALLLGAIVARQELLGSFSRMSVSRLRLLRALGGLMLVVSLLIIDKSMNFPGYIAALPAVGAALLLLPARSPDGLSKLLSIRGLTFIGILSYSAYLWHWPVLAFLRYGGIQQNAVTAMFSVVTIFILSWCSYRYVELPCRRSQRSFRSILTKQFVMPSAAVAVSCLVFMKIDGYGLHQNDTTYREAIIADKQQYKQPWEYEDVCQYWQLESQMFAADRCLVKARSDSAASKALLWGDSNAAHYVGIFARLLQQLDTDLKNISISACPPLLTDPAAYVGAKNYQQCSTSLELMAQHLNAYPLIIISASWPTYVERGDDFMSVFEQTLQEILQLGKKVILVGKAPVFDGYQRDCNIRALRFPFMACHVSERPIDSAILHENKRLKAMAERYADVQYMDINDMLCDEKGTCSIYDSTGMPLYIDSSHLAISSSWRLGAELVQNQAKIAPMLKLLAD